jgi:hypothetical protein
MKNFPNWGPSYSSYDFYKIKINVYKKDDVKMITQFKWYNKGHSVWAWDIHSKKHNWTFNRINFERKDFYLPTETSPTTEADDYFKSVNYNGV